MLLSFFSQVINSYLKLDPDSLARLKKLAGKTIRIELLPFKAIFDCHFTETAVEIKETTAKATKEADNEEIVITKIKGTPLQFVGISLNKTDRQKFFADDVKIEGDAVFGQEVIALFDEMEIDWEEYLSHVIGDNLSHQVMRVFHKIKHACQSSQEKIENNLNEYIHEEAECLPAPYALEDFFTDIDELRMDVDRLEAIIQGLEKKIHFTHEEKT